MSSQFRTFLICGTGNRKRRAPYCITVGVREREPRSGELEIVPVFGMADASAGGTDAAIVLGGRDERIVHDGSNRTRAAPAIGGAAEAAIDLGRRARAVRPRREAGLHVTVRKDVARANNHPPASLEKI